MAEHEHAYHKVWDSARTYVGDTGLRALVHIAALGNLRKDNGTMLNPASASSTPVCAESIRLASVSEGVGGWFARDGAVRQVNEQ